MKTSAQTVGHPFSLLSWDKFKKPQLPLLANSNPLYGGRQLAVHSPILPTTVCAQPWAWLWGCSHNTGGYFTL